MFRKANVGVSLLILAGLAALAIFLLAACGDSSESPELSPTAPGDGAAGATPTLRPGTIAGGEMRLTLVSGGSCEGTDCFVDAGSTFTLAVEVLEAPASYILLQTFIEYGVYDPAASEDDAGPGSCDDDIENGMNDGADRMDTDCVVLDLTYLPTESAADELVWTDVEPATVVRADAMGPGLLGHGGITGLLPPLPESSETGVMVQVQMSCPAEAATVPISLLLYDDPLAITSGTSFVGPNSGIKIVPSVTPITLHCVTQ